MRTAKPGTIEFDIENAAHMFVLFVVQFHGQTREQQEEAAEAAARLAGFPEATTEAQDWVESVIFEMPRGRYEEEVSYVERRIAERRSRD